MNEYLIIMTYFCHLFLSLAAIFGMVYTLIEIMDSVKTKSTPRLFYDFGDGERELIAGRWVRRRDG